MPQALEGLGAHRTVVGETVRVFEVDSVESLERVIEIAHFYPFPDRLLWNVAALPKVPSPRSTDARLRS